MPAGALGKRRGSVMLLVFWCLMAVAVAVYALHRKVTMNCRMLAGMVEIEQCYWAAVGGAERTAAWLQQTNTSINKPNYVALLKGADPPKWFRGGVMGHVSFEVAARPYSYGRGVSDEGGRFNLNHFPDNNVARKLFSGIPTIRDPIGLIARIEGLKRVYEINRRKGGNGRWYPYDYFRHPYELFDAVKAGEYLGFDLNENSIADPLDRPLVLEEGLRCRTTVFTESKVNPFTADIDDLDALFVDFAKVKRRVIRDRRHVKASVRAGAYEDWPDPFGYYSLYSSPRKQREYMSFARNLTRELKKVRIFVHAYSSDGTWRGTLEEVLSADQNSTLWTLLRKRFRRGM